MGHKLNIALFIVNVLLSFLLCTSLAMAFQYAFFAFILFFVILSVGVIWIRFNYFHKAVHTFQKDKVLLTFDDGPNAETTPFILDVLKRYNIKAIFFVIGKQLEKHPELVQRTMDEGHLVGNHTYTHSPFFAMLPLKKVSREIAQLNECLEGLNYTCSTFRPPIGYMNPTISRAVKQADLKIIGWSARSFDTVFKSANRLSKRLIRLCKPGRIMLLHDNLNQTKESLEAFIEGALKNGVIFANESDIKSFLDEK